MIADWFTAARLGVFVHWDHASQAGLELSWPMAGGLFALPHCQVVPAEEYHAHARTFDPQGWDADDLAARAVDAGAGYAVLTAKHHSGFAMWPTAQSDHSIAHTPYGRDIVGSFVEATRSAGLRVGLYFSLSDWHHPAYPPLRDEHRPYLPGHTPPMPDEATWARYLDFQRAQLRELLTDYGRIDLLWFDGGWERPAAAWKPRELEAMLRELQPGIVLNDRLYGVGDYATPEQFVPSVAPDGPWETCMTMNESWGWNPDDPDLKSGRRLVHTLCEVAGKGGNLLLNVSPRGDGTLPPEQVERLAHVGRWMDRHAEAVVDTEPGLEPWQFYGPSTRHGRTTYLHLLSRPYEEVTVRGVPVRRVRSVRVLGTGEELAFRTRTGVLEMLQPDPDGELTIEVPLSVLDDDATVLAVELDDDGG